MKKRVNEIGVEDIVGAGLCHKEAQNFHQRLTTIFSSLVLQDPKELWRQVCAQRYLQPSHPHALHQLVYHSIYADWDASSNGPPMYWFPSREQAKHTNLGRMMGVHGRKLLGDSYKDPISSFTQFYNFSVDHPEVYLSLVLKELSVTFHESPKCILDTSDKSKRGGRWLPGEVMNIGECCLFPIRKEDSSVAIVWRDEHLDDSPVKSLTLKGIRDEVMVVANALDTIFSKGDAIAIDMPMTANAVIVYLAIVLAGCVVVSMADSFAPKGRKSSGNG